MSDETPQIDSERCAACGRAIAQPATGRRREVCSPACRTKRYRDRQWDRQYAELIDAGAVTKRSQRRSHRPRVPS